MEHISGPETNIAKLPKLCNADIGQPVIVYLLDKDPKKKIYGSLLGINDSTEIALVSVGIGKSKEYKYEDVEVDYYSAHYTGKKPALIIPERIVIKKSPTKKTKFIVF